MESKPPDSEFKKEESLRSPRRSIVQLERMISIIDDEIVREGEGIDPGKLERLTTQKGEYLIELAKLRGESIDDALHND